MPLILLILGILLTGAGIVTIGFGIPINEFNLGNTLIVAGTIAAAAGLILIGLAAAVEQLTQIAKALRPRAPARPAEQAAPGRPGQAPAVQVPVQVPAQPPLQAPAQVPVQAPARPATPVPPRSPVFARARAPERAGDAVPAEPEPEAPFSAIERLRSSLPRTDRRADDVEGAEDVPYVPAPAAPAAPGQGAGPGPGQGAGREANRGANPATNGAAPTGAAEAIKKPALDFLFRSKAREPQPEAFEAVWPKRGQRRLDEEADADQPARPAAAEAPTERPAPAEPYKASAPEDIRPAAILKSGVVDGMAYTLYADGSIEAQLPQGTVRFGSIAELRSHIENNS
jgi:hypothetical protein